MQEEIIGKLTSLKNGIAQYEDVIGTEADDLRKECSIISADDMKAQLSRLEEENRLLNIGIIGRVKAGKSSLLNSIFFKGESVLPKAATPMTASLTVMTYGDAFSATVEYFSPDDIKNIEKEHAAYKAEWERKYEENKKIAEERAKKYNKKVEVDNIKRSTDSAMKENPKYASFDQWEKMKGTQAPAGTTENLDANSQAELLGKLNEYVGSGGTKMPYTKSAEIRFPLDALRDIRVVDTPGINDPVKSREARTEDYLKECDVVFIVSPAGQFISSEDMKLMDKLTVKEGVNQLYLIASQADNQLYGMEVLEKSNRNLNKAVQMNSADLSSQALSNLSGLKKNNPEIGGQFDQVLKEGAERVMITSAMCHAMLLKFDDRNSWDEDMKHVWGLLHESYTDHFDSDASARVSLELLSGMQKVSDKIGQARSRKVEIMAEKKNAYITAQMKNVNDFSKKLIDEVKEKIEKVKNTDKANLEEQKKNNEKLFSKGTEAVDGTFEDCVDDFKALIRNAISEKSRTLFTEAKKEYNNTEKSRTEQGSYTTGILFWKKTHHYTNEIRTLRTGVVKNTLNDLVASLQDSIVITVEEEKKNWKSKVQREITSALTEAVEDIDLINTGMLKTSLRRIVNNMELPNLDLGSNTFSSSFSGTIEDNDIDRFDDEVQGFLANLKNVFNKERDDFISVVEKNAKKEKMSDMIFSELKKQLETLEKEIENKELTLDRLKKCCSVLEKVN